MFFWPVVSSTIRLFNIESVIVIVLSEYPVANLPLISTSLAFMLIFFPAKILSFALRVNLASFFFNVISTFPCCASKFKLLETIESRSNTIFPLVFLIFNALLDVMSS